MSLLPGGAHFVDHRRSRAQFCLGVQDLKLARFGGSATRGVRAGVHTEAEIVTVADLSFNGFGSNAEISRNWGGME